MDKIRVIETEQIRSDLPDFSIGDTLKIHYKIIEGKIGKFLKGNCLVNQPFVKDDSKTVGQALEEAAKSAGGEARIKRFVRFEIG